MTVGLTVLPYGSNALRQASKAILIAAAVAPDITLHPTFCMIYFFFKV
jgi:hypothetical protein